MGSLKLLREAGVPISQEAEAKLSELQAEGKTAILVAVSGRLAGLLAVADTLRPKARPMLEALARAGIHHTILLTGDNAATAAAIARQAGVSEFRAGLLPEDKLAAVRALREQYGEVGMVGDGVNDAPALASADVGIAMGGAAPDVALETADVALMASDLSRLPFAVGLGRASRAIIRQNLAIALGVIAVLAAAALGGVVGIGLAVVVHEGSTLVVALNALRLLAYDA